MKFAFLLFLFSIHASAADQISQILDAAVDHSERLATSKSSSQLTEFRKAIAETDYLPNVAAEAIDSTGYGGSTGLLGIGGIMGSPYRAGYGYGLVLTQTLFDFGKSSRERSAAEAAIKESRAEVKVVREDVLRATVDAYVQCSLAESERSNWADIDDEANVLSKEISKFVRTGQKSVVEESLARGQHDEASRTEQTFEKRIAYLKKRLAVMTGWAVERIDCDGVEKLSAATLSFSHEAASIERAEAALAASTEDLRAARGNYLPKIVGIASVGDVEDTRVVAKSNYALGIGLTIPIFDSGKTNVEVDRAKVNIERSTHQLKAAQQKLDDENAQYDEAIQAAQTELELLKADLADAQKAFDQAKSRYTSMSGTLVDLRESVRGLSRVKAELSEYKAQLVRMTWNKAILNGAK